MKTLIGRISILSLLLFSCDRDTIAVELQFINNTEYGLEISFYSDYECRNLYMDMDVYIESGQSNTVMGRHYPDESLFDILSSCKIVVDNGVEIQYRANEEKLYSPLNRLDYTYDPAMKRYTLIISSDFLE